MRSVPGAVATGSRYRPMRIVKITTRSLPLPVLTPTLALMLIMITT